MNDTNKNAIVLTAGILDQPGAKTAHGLIRVTSRFNIVGVIDKKFYGQDAGEVIDRKKRNIPVYRTIEDFLSNGNAKAGYAVVGVALPGGKLPAEMISEIKQAIQAGMSIVSGMHDFLSDMPELSSLAATHGVSLLDIRKPRTKDQLKFWTGNILKVKSPIIGVLGTDCALGKRTTAVMITEAMNKKGIAASMIFTGQTGWLQGHKYGFILDSTYNDFISGELENAIVTCYKEANPDVIFVEGQSALCNPSGPCGAELLLSAQCRGVILQHAPGRIYYNDQEHTGIKISLQREMEIIRLYGATIIALTLNTKGLSTEEAFQYKQQYEEQFRIPVVLPLEEGMDELSKHVSSYIQQFEQALAPA